MLQNREWYEKNKDKLQLTGKVGDLNEYEIFKEVVGVDKNGNNVELRADTKDWMIGYSRDLVEAVAIIKPGDRIKFSDGSIYYVQPSGELYKEDSIGALMPYKEISLEDHNVISKRESLFDKDTVISDDHHEKAGQYVYDTVGNFSELITALTAIVSTVNITNKNHIIALKISTSSILLIYSTNGITSTLTDSWHDIIDNEGKQYNPLKNILGEENYNNFDSTAKVISLTGDAKKLYEIIKNKNFSNIDWDSIVTDEFEQNKLIDTLDNLGLMLDIKTINELRGLENENKQNN